MTEPIQYWEGCGPSCCRCHCNCRKVRRWRREEAKRWRSLTPDDWAQIRENARRMAAELRELSE